MKKTISRDQVALILIDLFSSLLLLWFSTSLRNEAVFIFPASAIVIAIAACLIVPISYISGVYKILGSHVTRHSLKVITKAYFIYGLSFLLACLLFYPTGIPRSVGVIQPILALLFSILARVLIEKYAYSVRSDDFSKDTLAVIFGAGSTGRMLHAALKNSSFEIVGFVDDSPHFIGRTFYGVQIYGRSHLKKIRSWGVDNIFIAIPSLSGDERNSLFRELRSHGFTVKTVPSLVELALGKYSVANLRSLELEDLLGRPPIQPDKDLMKRDIADRVVLVTGAGGSIGSELCRQILNLKPKCLILLDHNEFGLFTIEQELINSFGIKSGTTKLLSVLGSAVDFRLISKIISDNSVDTVFHAAAYKHVHLVETNPIEGLRNNVLSTLAVVKASVENGVSSFVLVSTDKAVKPANVMGLSKRVSEIITQGYAKSQLSRIRLSAVRFGNVLGSAGSVVPIFTQQIKKGGPVTITDENATRFFMTIPEAASLVIQAGAISNGGDIFLLDMGEPVKILNLAKSMIELQGYVPTFNLPVDGEIQIVFTGLKAGEKLHEMLAINKASGQTSHSRILRIVEPFGYFELLIDKCNELLEIRGEPHASQLIKEIYSLVNQIDHSNSD
jgi:FlaA1/EpsC-like NDP-sugar epimerase